MIKVLNFIAAIAFFVSTASAQHMSKGLLWQITGNGLTKPSYLYGTMHVSNKVAFNLSDSFFIAIQNCDKVALETSPENWLEEFMGTQYMGHIMRMQNTGNTFSNLSNSIAGREFSWFEKLYSKSTIQRVLSQDPSLLNQLLYRQSGAKQDFEEDTYLDLYIFQTASRLRKPVVSVEDFDESTRLVMLAYANMYPEGKTRKYTPDFDRLLEDYYRQADLGKIDSLLKTQGYSEEYQENMLYIRNRNMLQCMDSIMKKETLFTGVGAAHLPGENGLINLLREKGYTVRAVNLGARNASIRNKIDKIEVPISYRKFNSADALFSVDVPGKMMVMPDKTLSQQYLYTDMMNGSFYTVNRIKTLSRYMGLSDADLEKVVDSLLYEFIPGTILSLKSFNMNGYKAYDISNKTRRGDLQYYRIVFTPLELFVAKAGGRNEYMKKNGVQFIQSFTVNKPTHQAGEKRFVQDGFAIDVPTQLIANFEASNLTNYAPPLKVYQGIDQDGITYYINKQIKYNNTYLEEDTIELNLIERGFVVGLETELVERSYVNLNGLPGLKCVYYQASTQKNIVALFVIKGAWVYWATAWCSKDYLNKAQQAIQSFKLIPVQVNEGTWQVDSIHLFTVKSPWPLAPDINANNFSFKKRSEKENYKFLRENMQLVDAATGTIVNVNWQRLHKYFTSDDTAKFWKEEISDLNPKELYIQKVTYTTLPNALVADVLLTDTNSSKVLMNKIVLSGRYIYTLQTLSDTVTMGEPFAKAVFNSFQTTNTDTSWGSVFTDKTDLILKDLVSEDSASYAQARELVSRTRFQGKDYQRVVNIIEKLKEDKYKKEIRNELVAEIGFRKNNDAIVYLKKMYENADDDYNYQMQILKALASINTPQSYKMCKDLMLEDPPFASEYYMYARLFSFITSGDSLWNRKVFLPELLKLSSNEEYKIHTYELLAEAIDSNKITLAQYQPYLLNVLTDARKTLRREMSKNDEENFEENEDLMIYNHILIKQYDTNKQAREYFQKQLKAKNYFVQAYAIGIMLANNKAVSDSVLLSLAADDEKRTALYFALDRYKQKAKFPASYKSPTTLVYSIVKKELKPSYGNATLDTIILLDSCITYFKGKTGKFYYYKYKMSNNDDWNTYACGLFGTGDEYTELFSLSGKGEVFTDKKTVGEQFQKLVERIKDRNRAVTAYKSYNSFWDNDYDD